MTRSRAPFECRDADPSDGAPIRRGDLGGERRRRVLASGVWHDKAIGLPLSHACSLFMRAFRSASRVSACEQRRRIDARRRVFARSSLRCDAAPPPLRLICITKRRRSALAYLSRRFPAADNRHAVTHRDNNVRNER